MVVSTMYAWKSSPYQVMTLSAIGLALTPAGGSVCMRLKSRINLLRAAVDIVVASSSSLKYNALRR